MSFYLCAFRSSNNVSLAVNYIISSLEVWWSLSNRGMLETLGSVWRSWPWTMGRVWIIRGHDIPGERSMTKENPKVSEITESSGVGLHPTSLQAQYLPSLKIEERGQSQWQRHQCFKEWGISHVWIKVWSDTPPYGADGRQDMAAVFAPREERDYSYRGTWSQVGSSVAKETSRGAHPSPPLW